MYPSRCSRFSPLLYRTLTPPGQVDCAFSLPRSAWGVVADLMSLSSRRSDGFSPALVIPLGVGEMGEVLAGRVGRVAGWVFGAVVGLPTLAVWLCSMAVAGLGRAPHRRGSSACR